ncbi:MAG: RimK/LysX family protein [Pseudomonadota bacterium]|nr:RimK/LysX family protein [Pseudomonadota bacterium]
MTGPVFGWEEWAALPALGLAGVKAKLDTGAWTGALHALEIELDLAASPPQVRFVVHPWAERPDAAVRCAAELADRRAITSSDGRRELRPVIRTLVTLGGLQREVELSLTDRAAMTYRLLLGRRAIGAFGALVDVSRRGLGPVQEPAVEGVPASGGLG